MRDRGIESDSRSVEGTVFLYYSVSYRTNGNGCEVARAHESRSTMHDRTSRRTPDSRFFTREPTLGTGSLKGVVLDTFT